MLEHLALLVSAVHCLKVPHYHFNHFDIFYHLLAALEDKRKVPIL